MIAGTDTSVAAAVLDGARGHRRDADAAEAALLTDVLAWCELHVTDDPDEAETFGDTPVLLGGDGCPWIREFTITELATALHLSAAAGRELVADVLELAFRLPRLWAKVQAGRAQAWRARRVARQTQHLSIQAASFVDNQVAEYATRIGAAAVERLVNEAIARFMPELARRRREQAADQRHFTIDHQQVSFAGTSLIEGELDLADALDLDAALAHIAGELKDLGNEMPLDQRRALAAGELARAQYSFLHDFDPAHPDTVEPGLVGQRTPARVPADSADGDVSADAGTASDTTTRVCSVAEANPDPGRFGRRDLTLYVHLPADALTGPETNPGTNPDAMVTVEGRGGRLIRLETLREWLHVAGNVHVTIRPVIDLNADLTSNGRFATGLQREQVTLRDRTCVAPYCERPARHLDLDHIDPWTDQGRADPDDTGPPGPQTRSGNLAALCRHHHRAKTLTSWTYQQLTPGVFAWTSPHGLRYLTFTGQTIDLN